MSEMRVYGQPFDVWVFGSTGVHNEKLYNNDCHKIQWNDMVMAFSMQESVGSECNCVVKIQKGNKINQIFTQLKK